jgi:hypothetical protein
VEDGAIIPFIVQVTDGAVTWEYEANIPVEAPVYNLISVDILDSGNGTLDPGETTTMQLVLTNIGHTPVNYPTFEVTTSDPNITLGDLESDNAYFWGIGDQITVTIDVIATEDAPIGHTALVGMLIGAIGTNYEHIVSIPITLGQLIEDFETATFTTFDWIHNGEAEWSIDSDAYSGSYSAKSGEIGHNESSELSLIMNILYEGNISFWAKASSEQGGSGTVYDYLEFFIDDESAELMIGGEIEWTEYSVSLPPGEHLLRWVYQKDGAQTIGDDCSWIDRIVFPPGAIQPLNVDFGDLNFDGIVNILDVIVTVNAVIGYIEISNDQFQNADMNLDGVVDVLDVLMIVDVVLDN